MSEQTFGPRRCRDSRKLSLDECVTVHFYQCKNCRSIIHECGPGIKAKSYACCGEEMILLTGKSLEEIKAEHPQVQIDYQIVGGYNENAIRISWNQKDLSARPEWIYLKTFTGGYLKILQQTKRPPLVYALADTDAFSYCDESPCLECTFRCKRGFEIYAYIEQAGLIQISLDKMSPYWESR